MLRCWAVAFLFLCALPLGACGADPGTAAAPTPGGAAALTATPLSATPAPTAALAATSPPTHTAPTAAATPTLPPGMFANPVIRQDFPDPDVLKVGDTYYAYATGNFEAKISIQAARSTDLVHWEISPDALPAFAPWAEPDPGLVWAPEVTTTADGKGYVMYFAARVAGTSIQCIGVARSAKPEGPFASPDEQPFICQRDRGGSIDPSSFVDEDGTRYLLWKNDGNSGGGETWLTIQRVSADGRTLEGEATQLVKADQSWEGQVVEAPTLWKHAGKYYLFYSANAYNTPQYAIGYAVADTPLGPYQKATKPLVASKLKDGVVGPGGQDIVVGPDGATWMAYHSWGPGYRTMSLDELAWDGETPVLKGPDGPRVAQPVP
jgi:arabinan endo-1,5-alpha-L-arabinosidase